MMKTTKLLSLGALVSSAIACGGHIHARHHHEDIEKRQALSLDLGLIAITLDLGNGISTVITTTTSLPASSASTTQAASTTATTQSASTSVSTTLTTSSRSSSSTSSSSSKTSSSSSRTSSAAVASGSSTVKGTILVIARDQAAANQAINGLNGYGIPYQTLLVPQDGTNLPALNSSTNSGNFGGFVIMSGIAYYYESEGTWRSALTNDQMNQLYAYQTAFGVRMVQLDAYPQYAYGTDALGGCCDSGSDQLISFTNTTSFAQAGLRTGAGMSTSGLYHYPAKITDPSTTTQIASFGAGGGFNSESVAAVLQNIQGREQMAFFINWATDWSPTSNFLQHAYITWMTRGLYAGYRRVNLNTQIDDVMLPTGIYYPGNSVNTYRITPNDMNIIRDWVPKVSAKMNPGSWYRVELGYNGNGNIRAVDPLNTLGVCQGGPIYTKYDTTALEFQKPLGTGVDGWPAKPATYPYTADCLKRDPLSVWMQTQSNRDAFLHISHTFSHEGQNNATYSDIAKEISWNQRWLKQTNIALGNFSANGIIPPAITGLHNGDALKAWYDNGITNCVGDNSRPVLRNQQNPMYAYNTTVAANGFAGITVIPRWSLRIYYNCDSPECTTQQWIDTSGGSGGFSALMGAEKFDVLKRFFGLYRDGVMFHQLNLRTTNMTMITNQDGSQVPSLFQAWVEQTVLEFGRLVNWPLITLKQSDLASAFIQRQMRDNCQYSLTWNIVNKRVTGVTVSTNGNVCGAAIPVTLPGPVTAASSRGFQSEKVGNDPLTVWVRLTGQPVTLALSTPISL